MTYEAFDVVVVPFPFSDRNQKRRRPAVVVSNRSFGDRHAHAILAMITTSAHSSWPTDTVIEDLAAAGLNAASVVRLKLFTLDTDLLVRKIGALAEIDRHKLEATLRASLL